MNAEQKHAIARAVYALFGEPYPVNDIAFTVRSVGGGGVRYTLVTDEATLNIVTEVEEIDPSPNAWRKYKRTGYTWFLTASGRVTDDGRYNGKIEREVL